MPEEDQPRFSARILLRLLGEYRSDRSLAVLTGVIAVATALAELLPSLFTRNAINYIEDWLRAGQAGPLAIWPFAIPILLMVIIQNLLRFSQTMARTELGTRITNRLRERMYAAVQRHSLTYHKKTSSGDLISRSTRDIGSISRFVNFGVFGVADLVIFLAGSVCILLWVNPVFALVALSPLPAAIFLTVRFGSRSRDMWRRASESYGQVTTVLQENIAGARVVRAFAQEQAETGKFARHADDYVRRTMEVLRYWVVRTVSANLVFSMVMPIALLSGSFASVRGWIAVGDIMLCFFYMRDVQHRLYGVIKLVEIYQSAAAGAERVFEILDEEPSIRSHPGALALPAGAGGGTEVEFRQVTFGYQPEKLVLNGISFAARPGQTIGIVGHTGSGKSTLISLIPRFHDPSSGAVLFNGTDVRSIKLRQLRRAVGMIFQETFLFSATVRENIAYGRPDAGFDAVQAAAQAARAHEFITELDDGYDTVIGERGVTLSGGQAQRLAIARAVLLNPKVLIMDDATASVDSETERQIRETMKRLAEGRTTFVIAHRVSSVAHADRILVLADGRVAEEGTHDELVALGGIYRRMCDQQFSGAARL